MQIRKLASPAAPAAIGPYSQAIAANGFVFCSGQLGLDPATGSLAAGVRAQAEQSILNIAAILASEKLGLDRVVKATVFLADMYIVVAEKQGVSAGKLNGTIQNDILKEYVARGTYIFPPTPSMRLITNIFEYCEKEVPNWNTISISGYHIREAGSTAVQEVAFTLADGIAYVEAALKAGLAVDDFAPRLSFFFNAHNDLFEEVAKFRAARRVWAKIMGVLFGKLMCWVTKGKVNPLIGSAGVSAVPMAARVSQVVGQESNPNNYLLMHAMGPNVAGVIGSAIAAGVMLAVLG